LDISLQPTNSLTTSSTGGIDPAVRELEGKVPNVLPAAGDDTAALTLAAVTAVLQELLRGTRGMKVALRVGDRSSEYRTLTNINQSVNAQALLRRRRALERVGHAKAS